MKIILTLLLIFLSLATLFAEEQEVVSKECTIEMFKNILVLQNDIAPRDIIKSSTCTLEFENKLVSVVSTLEGKIKGKYLSQRILDVTDRININLVPENINIINAKTIIRKNLKISEDWKITSIKSLDKRATIHYERGTAFVTCAGCSRLGEHTINIEISGDDRKSVWPTIRLEVEVEALISTINLNAGKTLSPSYFREGKIYTSTPHIYTRDQKNLGFYKLNRPIIAGAPLIESSLIANTLIRRGDFSSVRLDANGIKLSGTARALKNGKLGDTIPLEHLSSKKIMYGKVIGINKVEIDL